MINEERFIKLNKNDIENRSLKLLFNDEVISISTQGFETEVCPGIFIKRNLFFNKFFRSLEINILNKRDSVIIYLYERQNNQSPYTILFESHKNTYFTAFDENSLKIPLDSIHYPINETGGDGERCRIKLKMKELNVYPENINGLTNRKYNLFSYEDIFSLPDSIDELKDICKSCCFERNIKENKGIHECQNIIASKNKLYAANQLVNNKFSKVSLRTLGDKSLYVTNGNHRICFLKRFKEDFGIDYIQLENWSQIEKEDTTDKLSKDIIKKIKKAESKLGYKDLGYNYTRSYYEEMASNGFSKQEALKVLTDGMSPAELYKAIIRNKNKI